MYGDREKPASPGTKITREWYIRRLADKILQGRVISSTVPDDEYQEALTLAKEGEIWVTMEYPEQRRKEHGDHGKRNEQDDERV
jgi:hypothetical protein